MADNSSPQSYNPLILHLSDAADGAHTYGTVIGLVHNTEVNIRADLDALVGTPAGPGGVPPAVPGLKALWNAAQEKQVVLTAAFNAACAAGIHLSRTCIHALMPVLGEHWNTNWTSAGFSGSLAVPDVPLVMLQQLRAYYTTNANREPQTSRASPAPPPRATPQSRPSPPPRPPATRATPMPELPTPISWPASPPDAPA